tara:strand:+ start:399 stop:722 length:324 start_codon:yes stop_codon:yes gene_type:complete
MKYFFFLISMFLVFQFRTQLHFDNTIVNDNCRYGESVGFCRTHKVMNFFKSHSSSTKIHEDEQSQLRIIEDSMKLQSPFRAVYTIPLVFHVLFDSPKQRISTKMMII